MKKQVLAILICCSSYLFSMKHDHSDTMQTKEQVVDACTIVQVAQRCAESLSLGEINGDGIVRVPNKINYLFCSSQKPLKRDPENYVLVLLASVDESYLPQLVTVSGRPNSDDSIDSLAHQIAISLEDRSVADQNKDRCFSVTSRCFDGRHQINV